MSEMWSAERAGRAQRRRLVGPCAEEVEIVDIREVHEPETTDPEVDCAVLLQLIQAAADLKIADPQPLAALLAKAVSRLVRDIVGSATIVDQPLLQERAIALASAIHGSKGPITLQVHPDCLPMLAGLSDDIVAQASNDIERGQLVMGIGTGFAEDGISSALDRLDAALDALA